MDLPASIWTLMGGLGGVVLSQVGTWLVAVVKTKPAAQQVVNEGFVSLVAGLREDLAELRQSNTELKGIVRDLDQHLLSLEERLRVAGLEIPRRPHPHPILSVVT